MAGYVTQFNFVPCHFSCDLAGSERIKKTGAEGERLSELQHVNLSLLELGYVQLYCISFAKAFAMHLLVLSCSISDDKKMTSYERTL